MTAVLAAAMLPASAATGDVLLQVVVQDGSLVVVNAQGTSVGKAWPHGTTVNADGSFTTSSTGDMIRLDFSVYDNANVKTSTGWTLSFDAALTSTTSLNSPYPVLCSIGIDTNTNLKPSYYINDSKWIVDPEKLGDLEDRESVSGFTLDTKVHHYDLSVSGTGLVEFYIDSALAATASLSSSQLTTLDTIGYFSLGGKGFSETANTMPATFSNVVIREGAIPEPATATLSLLALAGLAARRRRK